MSPPEAIISIKPKFVASILNGTKLIELRRRRVHLARGTRLWIYSTLPTGAFVASAQIKAVHVGSPKELKKFLDAACISEKEYQEYFCGSDQGCAIELSNVVALTRNLSLAQARKVDADFHPPQFFKRLLASERLASALQTRTNGPILRAA